MAHQINGIDVCIIIPTYNERENIVQLLEEVFRHVERENRKRDLFDKVNLKVLVVDDNSPDGTGEAVKNFIKKDKRVHLLERQKKNGLGAAYKAGMKYALKEFNPDILFEMDADFSHNPRDVIRMVNTVNEGYDFVIGSRYIDGGSTPRDWGSHRKFISFAARTITRKILGLEGIKDCSGGFRAIRSEVLRSTNFDDLVGDGYGFQASLLEEAYHNGFKIKEIPIIFNNRNKGSSKMSFFDIFEGWLIVFKIRMKRLGARNGKNI